MNRRPIVLVSPNIESKGKEFADLSISLSQNYQTALINAGAIPLTLPATTSHELIAECVRAADGVLLTGGDDVEPQLYAGSLPGDIRAKVHVSPDAGARDYRELLLIQELFRQHKPLLAICRGQQILNVALGGTLYADIPSQVPGHIDHRRMDKRSNVVHEVQLTSDSLLAKITSGQKLGVNSTHHQAVRRVAPPLVVSATGPDGVIEGLELRREAGPCLPFLLSVQFHPERLADRYAAHAAIFRAFTSACAASRKRNL